MTGAEPNIRIRARAERAGIALRSRDLTAALGLLALAAFVGLHGFDCARALLAWVAAGLSAPADPAASIEQLAAAGQRLVGALSPLPGFLLAAPLLSMALQALWGGAAPSPWARRPRSTTAAGSDAVARLWAVLKLSLLSLLAIELFVELTPQLVAAMSEGTLSLKRLLPALLERGLSSAVMLVVAIALLDMLVQRQRFFESLSLDPTEARRERRAEEGDPAVRAQVRRRARADGAHR